MSDVNCTGSEPGLHVCPSAGLSLEVHYRCKNHTSSAGVICSKNLGEHTYILTFKLLLMFNRASLG